MYYCKYCNREFTRINSCTQHERYYCNKNPNKRDVHLYREHKKAICEICGQSFDVAVIQRHLESHSHLPKKVRHPVPEHEGLNCQFCGKECKNKNSLKQHEIRCHENPDRADYTKLTDYIVMHRRGKNKDNCVDIEKASESLKKRYANGSLVVYTKGKTGTFKGKQHTIESKEKIRLSTLKNIKNKSGQVCPNYNVRGCQYIENLNKENNWKLQHAENGGECCIDGYYLDGYDEVLNIVFEYDEPRHYEDVSKNILKIEDIERMNNIINKLHCRFFRYNEQIDYFYEVTMAENSNIETKE